MSISCSRRSNDDSAVDLLNVFMEEFSYFLCVIPPWSHLTRVEDKACMIFEHNGEKKLKRQSVPL